MKNTIIGSLIFIGALTATPAMAQEMTTGTATTPALEAPVAPERTAEPQVPRATMDSNGDGTADAWDRNGDGTADAWDTDGDGKPDKADPMEEAATGE